jgi:hypothetical protein
METVLLPGKQVRRGGLRHHLGSVTFITTGERIGSAALKVASPVENVANSKL